jgi:hypothetical protein
VGSRFFVRNYQQFPRIKWLIMSGNGNRAQ